MITKKSLISGFLAISFAVNPLYIQTGFWDVLNPFNAAKIFFESKTGSGDGPIEDNLNYLNFSTVQNDSVLAVRPITSLKTYKPKKFYTVSATGYSSTPEQTDHTPFITASGIHVRDGVIAANFLPFGTIIKIPELFGDKIFVVEDRMHSRYWFNIDIWFPGKELAKEFGIKVIKIEIVS
ncbi:MAG: 3D domain-containing protein [Parcubacteria group bacterium]|nr:3D domain-containing protein [Parcubacteria group bacterium]